GHTAYLLFSENTRRNGGILIEHFALLNFFYSLQNIYGGNLGPRDRCLSLTDISLDISLCEIVFPLIFGAMLVLLPDDKASIPEMLAKTIVDKSIHFAFIPPVLLKEVCRSLKVYGSRVVLDKLMSGGEFIEESILKEYLELNNKMQIITAYGPVETTIAATLYPFHLHPGRGLKTPAGRPLGNTGIFLLDRRQNLCPPGTYGELYISGPGLARGYLNRPELTAEKFIKNTFSTAARMFKTGESGRWTEEGNLDFPVIIDNRVTIRGTHIDLEDQLLEHKSIKQAVAVEREGDGKEKYLCAYIVYHPSETGTNNTPAPSQLIEFLSLELPPFMIPQYFIQVENIPRTSGGEVDRKALPGPHLKTILNYAAPQKETEKTIAGIWKEVLGKDKIGINDNFFEVGGNSLGLIKVKLRIKEKLGKEIADIKFLEYPTIETFCAYLDLEILNTGGDFKEETSPVEIMEDIGHDKLRLRSKILENEDIY
ncbi:MAG: non-ribosomal peptide synthetase, partial [Acidobacteria bacterium]|nr:non-ribosomal peptide synthetase [Acidobacteriota bacterium]